MSKPSKLTEKPTRIPNARVAQWEGIIRQYLQQVEPLKSEPARSHRFSVVLHDLLGIEPNFIDNYVSGIEKVIKVKQKDRILRGEVDNLFGNVIIEFERNIPQKRAEAEEQLSRYVAVLWSQELSSARRPYLGIATDGVRFIVYSPTVTDANIQEIDPHNVNLKVLEETDWARLNAEEIFYWLDRYFLREESLTPTSERIVHDFGIKSHAFQTATTALLTLWQEVKQRGAFAVLFDNWEKYLRIVYGSDVANDELFIRHTYLATLAKLMSWQRITEQPELPNDAQIVQILSGGYFKRLGIENFIEEDFFSWVAREEAQQVSIRIVRRLFSLLKYYDLRLLSEDVLKSLYQELVDPETRHDLGEYYTPDWLAHRIARTMLEEKPDGSVLDPACGSGTFLYMAIKEKRERLGDTQTTLRHILDSVCGADVHPLAVIVAKTNYILALGDLFKQRKATIAIPVFLTDSLRIPERYMQGQEYEIKIDSTEIYVHESLLQNPALYDRLIEQAKEFAIQNIGKEVNIESLLSFLAMHGLKNADDTWLPSLFYIARTLKRFMEADRDSIWAYVLRNMYKPLFWLNQFDFIIGNPPWIAFRFLDPPYQAFVKKQITQEYHLLKGRAELITHMEVASLFLLRAADLYLKRGGIIAFVLPRSLFSADQHDALRRREFQFSVNKLNTLYWREFWDCEGVSPLFSVPSCVIIAEKDGRFESGRDPNAPVPGEIIKGTLVRKNASLAEAEQQLMFTPIEFGVHVRGKRSYWAPNGPGSISEASPYRSRFLQGATIVPRSFWFVEIETFPIGINPEMPPIRTAPRAIEEAKAPYKDVRLEGAIQSRFLYATLLSTDLVPFGHLDYRVVLLPILPAGDRYQLLTAKEAREKYYYELAQWLERVEKEWEARRSAKAGRISAVEWLNYRNKLTQQNPNAKYRVVYPDVQRVALATLVEVEEIRFPVDGQEVEASNFVVDTTMYVCETDNMDEAHYLVSCLNSSVIDARLSHLRRRDQKGHPHVAKKIFDVAPIPEYDPESVAHQRLTGLGQVCTEKVAAWLAENKHEIKSLGKLRALVRALLQEELREIDALVEGVLR